MADLEITQSEAEALIAMEKHRASDDRYSFPLGGRSVSIPLQSVDKREQFLLDISRGRIDLGRGKYQNRARQVVVLVRLDFGGSPHRNPDGEKSVARTCTSTGRVSETSGRSQYRQIDFHESRICEARSMIVCSSATSRCPRISKAACSDD